jgi:signal transduction histidine kinase
VNPLRSVGARLSLALLVLVAGALAVVYVFVVPSLESRLVNAKLSQLRRAAPGVARQVEQNPFTFDLAAAAAAANARIVLYAVLSLSPEPQLAVVDDSGVGSSAVTDDPLALRTALSGAEAHGTVERAEQRYAEVAVLTADGSVLLLSASLRDALADVQLVQRRLLLAGGLALVVALLLGYGGAWAFARRLRRLEHAAERIARGSFDEPVVDRGGDEVAHLAETFEHMRRRLARLEHARRTFVANASHELRTPLFSLSGFLELLADEELDDATRREFLTTMREQVARLSKLATELLDLSRIDAGQLRVEREPVDLAEIAGALREEFAAVAQGYGRPLEIELDGAAVALADRERVLQIGRALVENAFVHAPSGGRVRIEVATANGRARLAVEDEGPGIPPEHAEQVFDRFYRVDGGAHASGSGLGLAIARELAELMGGTLRLGPGRGGRFELLLPLAAPSAISRENERAVARQDNTRRGETGS